MDLRTMNGLEGFPASLGELVSALAETNCALWQEDQRASDGDDLQRARVKRRIAELQELRSTLIREIDDEVIDFARKRASRA